MEQFIQWMANPSAQLSVENKDGLVMFHLSKLTDDGRVLEAWGTISIEGLKRVASEVLEAMVFEINEQENAADEPLEVSG